jgi:hypothetical protein
LSSLPNIRASLHRIRRHRLRQHRLEILPRFHLLSFLGVPVLYKYFPETKGLSLEEIGALFGDEVAVDLSHLTKEQREELDRNLGYDMGTDTADSGSPKGGELVEQEDVEVKKVG